MQIKTKIDSNTYCVLTKSLFTCIYFIVASGIIGYAPEVYKLMTHHKITDTDDDQLYYTKLYLDEKLRVRRK